MKKLITILSLVLLPVLCTSCRDTPLDTPQEERGGGAQGELGDDGSMDVD